MKRILILSLLFVTVVVFSQSFSFRDTAWMAQQQVTALPDYTNGLQFWYDAKRNHGTNDSGSIATEEDSVVTMTDVSGNNRHALATSAGEAIFRSGGLCFGGVMLPAMYSIPSSSNTLGRMLQYSNTTVVCVFSNAAYTASYIGTLIGSGAIAASANNGVGYYIDNRASANGSSTLIHIVTRGVTGNFACTNRYTNGVSISTLTYATFIGRPTNTVGSGRSDMYVQTNAVVHWNVTTAAAVNSASSYNVAIGAEGNTNFYFQGTIYELRIYDGDIGTNKSVVDANLQAKWGGINTGTQQPIVWLNSDDLPSSGTAISAWHDWSGNGLDFTNVSSARPTSTNGPNGKLAAHFNGTSQGLYGLVSSYGVLNNQKSCTAIAVFHPVITNVTSPAFFWSINTSASGRIYLGTRAGPNMMTWTSRRLDADSLVQLDVGVSSANTLYKIYIGRGDVANNSSSFYVDNGLVGLNSYAAAGNFQNANSQNACVGVAGNASWFGGQVAECLLFVPALNDTQQTYWYNYLTNKFAIQ